MDLVWTRALFKSGGRQCSDSTYNLGGVRAMTRLERVTETLRAKRNALAVAAPAWLRAHITPMWVDRYGLCATDFRLPKSQAKRQG
jgi:hypothetical protein